YRHRLPVAWSRRRQTRGVSVFHIRKTGEFVEQQRVMLSALSRNRFFTQKLRLADIARRHARHFRRSGVSLNESDCRSNTAITFVPLGSSRREPRFSASWSPSV